MPEQYLYYLVNHPVQTKNELVSGFDFFVFRNKDGETFFQAYYIPKNHPDHALCYQTLQNQLTKHPFFYIWE